MSRTRFLDRTSQSLKAASVSLAIGQLFALPVLANPSGGRVKAGAVKIRATAPARLDVEQTSRRAIIEWDSFSIASGEHTHFAQPSSDAIVLNRVQGGDVSSIFGALSADGRVVLVNSAGIHFGPSARVDLAGLIATSADVADADFLARDRLAFAVPGRAEAALVNEGTITVRDAGLAAFVAPWVENRGTIEAKLGRIALASGDAFTLDLTGDSLIELAVPQGASDALRRGVASSGNLSADGGVIALLSADGARSALDAAINLSGVARARTIAEQGGRIVLSAGDEARVSVAGTLDATGSGSAETGGRIELSGGQIALAQGARLDASGHAGGGAIRVGGDVQGSGALPRASAVAVQAGAELHADSLGSAGNGGSIVVWSDGTTEFAGLVSARGALGGFAEVSGHEQLLFSGDADLGVGGRLLLDPTEILIGDILGATVSTDTLRRQLIAGTNVDLLATDDIVLASTLDGRISNGGVPGGAVSLRSQNGSILLDADLITNQGAITLDAGVDVRMASALGGLSGGNGVALVVSDGAGALGNADITVRAGGVADLQFLATHGAVDAQTTGALTFNRDLGSLADPIAALTAVAGSIDLPATLVTANGGVTATAAGALSMLATDQILVSDGSGTTNKGAGAIQLSFGTGDLDAGDLETAGAVEIDYTGAASGKVTLTQQLGGSTGPIGSLDIDAPVVDQAASIVAQGDVRLGRTGANDCVGQTGCTILRRDIFTGGGDFEVRSAALIDPRRPLVDANGAAFSIAPVTGVTDAGALILAPVRAVQTINELAATTFNVVSLREFDLANGVILPNTAPFAARTVSTLVQNDPTLAALFPNVRQEIEGNKTSEGLIGQRVDTVWILTIDTTGGATSGDVSFAGTVTVPNVGQELQMSGFLAPKALDKSWERPGANCSGAPCSIHTPTNRWRALNPVLDSNNQLISVSSFSADSDGVSEFFELGISAGSGAVSFGGRVNAAGRLQLNVESAGALSFATLGTDCSSAVTPGNCFGSLRLPRALVTVDPVPNPSPPPALIPIRGLDESEATHYSFLPDNDDGDRVAGWLRLLGNGLNLVAEDLLNTPNDIVAFFEPRPGNSTNPTTGAFTSTPDAGSGRLGSAGGFSFTGGGGGLFDLGLAPGLPAGDAASIASSSTSQGEGATVAEEDPAAEGEAATGCPESAPSTYQATPGQAAFTEDARGEPYSVDVFCGTYRLVETADPASAHYRGLSFPTRDFWSDAGFVRAPESTSPQAP